MESKALPRLARRGRLTPCLRAALLVGLLCLTACPSTPPAASSGCEEGTLKPCTCSDGSKATMECSGGSYGACACAVGQDIAQTDIGSSDASADVAADAADIEVQSGDGGVSDVSPGDGATPDCKGGAACDDGEPCTTGDKCSPKGVCVGGPDDTCDDNSVCTEDSCKAGYGCIHKNLTGACDDGDACSEKDTCAQGKCSGAVLNCDDGNPCTTDSCDKAKGCVHTAVSGPCDDGNPCTQSDACDAGKCVGGTNLCACQADADCAAKDDGDLCNGTLYCDKSAQPYVCKINPATVVTCDTSKNSACSATSCDAKAGKCATTAQADGTACDADGSVCTAKDTCQAGACAADKAMVCDDQNPCTTDSCDPKAGCVFDANTAPCDADGTACTVGDQCKGKACVAGPKTLCDDGSTCTLDTCNPATGKCNYDPGPLTGKNCDDGDACTIGEVCTSGVCVGSDKPNCDDKNPCTKDSCSKVAGCVNETANGTPCDADGSACTVGDACKDKVCLAGAKVPCDDGSACTVDSCNPATGQCNYDPAPLLGKACDDGDACTGGDACAAGVCLGSNQVDCDDKNPCTIDSCDKKAGCSHSPINAGPCDADGNACTQDQCQAGVCAPGSSKVCDDKNGCTQDSCDIKTGACAYDPLPLDGKGCDADGTVCTVSDLCKAGKCTPGAAAKAGVPCDDGAYCTAGDSCNGQGGCIAGPAKDCNDSNTCTQDSCTEAAKGCVNGKVPAGTACNDGKFCAVGEVCDAGGSCGQGKAMDCSAGGCTLGSCNEALSKCEGQQKPDATSCDADGDACTAGDACKAGNCLAGAKKVCDDSKACTIDSCDAKSGNCVFDAKPLTDKACDADGNVCTAGDACQADGSCKAGAAAAAGASCTDGNPCTIGDSCAGTSCKPGNAKGCDDGDACTSDACDLSNGNCTHKALVAGAPCEDGKFCTTGETCDNAGKCTGGQAKVCGEGGCILGSCDEAKKACVGQTLPDGTLCNADTNGCTKNDYCQSGTCLAGAPVNCFVPGDACNTYSCESSGADTYQCPSKSAIVGTVCDDLLFCTVGDTCDGKGVCKSGGARDCAGKDGACATGICDETLNECLAKNKVDGTVCSLGNPCTSGDACKGGFCVAGKNTCPGGEDFRVATPDGNSKYGPPALWQMNGGQTSVGWAVDGGIWRMRIRRDLAREAWQTLVTVTGNILSNVVAYDYDFAGVNADILFVPDKPAGNYSSWDQWFGWTSCASNCCTYDGTYSGNGRPWDGGCVFGNCDTGKWNYSKFACLRPPFPFLGVAKWKNANWTQVTVMAGTAISDTAGLVYAPINSWIYRFSAGTYSGLVNLVRPTALAAFADGSFLTAWLDGTAQKFAKDGKLDGAKFPFSTTGFGASLTDVNDWPIAAATLPNGRYVIAWQTFDKQSTQGSDIRAQVFKNEPGAKAGSEFVVNTSVVGNQGRPRIAGFSDSSFAIFWEDNAGRDGDGSGIIGQWYNANGTPKGAEVVINSTTKGNQVLPNVSVDLTTDLVVIAWIDNGDTGHVKLARYDRNGKRDNGAVEQQVAETKTGEQIQPAFASPRVTNLQLGDGSFIAAWASENGDGNGYGVMARRYGVDGKPKAGEFKVNTYSTDNQWRPDVAADQAGNFVVVWESVGQDGDLEGVYAQRYLTNGAKSGAEFRLSVQTANEQLRPKVAMQPTGGFAVAFETYGATGGAGYDIGVRCFDKNGAATSQDVLANTFTTGAQTRPQIASVPDGSGRFIVTWQSYDQLGVGKQEDVYARLFNASCQALGDPILVNTITDGSAGMPSVEADINGNFTIAWQEYKDVTDGFNVWAQRYDTAAKPVGLAFRIHDWVKGDQTEPSVTYLPDSSCVITYTTAGEDEEGTAIKAVKYDSKGVKTDVEWMANRTYTGAQQTSTVVGRPNGTWVYAWNSPGWDGEKGTIVMRFSNSGDCLQDSDCNDQNVCTDDKCNAGKCQTANNTALCTTDNNACTTGDTCKDGLCQGAPVTCDDQNICTTDSCDAKTGKCVFAGIPWCNGGCYYSDKGGCGGCNCEAAVCNERPSCCSKSWDSLCVQLCNQKYGGCDKGL